MSQPQSFILQQAAFDASLDNNYALADQVDNTKQKKLEAAQNKKASLLGTEELSLFNSKRSADAQEGYLRVNDSSLGADGTAVIPGVNTGYYPKELVEQYTKAQEVTTASGLPEINEGFREKVAKGIKEAEADRMGVVDRGVNALKAIPTAFGKELVVDTADWVGETLNRATGGKVGWDVGTEEEKTKMMDNLLGYNRVFEERGMEEGKVYATKIAKALSDEKQDVEWSDVGNLLRVGLETPEVLTSSLGYLAALMVGFGKFTKTGQAISGIEKAVKAGTMTTSAAKEGVAAIKAAETTGQLATRLGLQNAGLLTVAAGNVNDQVDDFKENNGGVGPTAGQVTRMMATEVLNLGLDRFTDLAILRTPEAIKDLANAAKWVPKEGAGKVVGGVVAGAAKLAAAGSVEAAQEYTQTMMEIFNKQFETSKYGSGVEGVKNILTDVENNAEAILGAGFGAAMGAEMKAGSMAVEKAVEGIQNRREASTSTVVAPEVVSSSEDIQKYKDEYASKFNELYTTVDTLNKDNAHSFVVKINELEGLNQYLSDSEAAQSAKAFVSDVKDRVTALLPNQEFKLGSVEDVRDVIEFVLSSDNNYDGGERLTLGSESSNISPALKAEVRAGLEEFGTRNGLSTEEVQQEISRYEEVGFDAAEGNRGYLTYGRLLKGLMASGSPNQEAVQAVSDKLLSYQQSQIRAIDALEGAIEKAKVSTESFTVEGYKKADGNPFSVVVDTDKQRAASIATMERVLAEKKKNFDGISRVINSTLGKESQPVVEPVTEAVSAGVGQRTAELVIKDVTDRVIAYEGNGNRTTPAKIKEAIAKEFQGNATEDQINRAARVVISNVLANRKGQYTPEVVSEVVPETASEVVQEAIQPTEVDGLLDQWVSKLRQETALNVTVANEDQMTELFKELEVRGYKPRSVFSDGTEKVGERDYKAFGTTRVLFQVGKNTVLNTLPVDSITGLKGVVGKALDSFSKAIAPYSSTNRGATMYDAPARGILFSNSDSSKGQVNEAVVTTVQIAMQEAIYTTKDMLSGGRKTKEELATMFGVPEFSVTEDMVEKFNKGMLQKTLASSIGKSVVKLLGIQKAKDISSDSYERLVSDLGNTAIAMGIQQGLLVRDNTMTAKEYSAIMGKVDDYEDSESLVEESGEATISFIALGSKETVKGSDEEFKKVVEVLPGVVTSITGPFLQRPSPQRLEEQVTQVRKGLIKGVKVPEQAQEALTQLASTEWSVDMDGIRYIKELVEADAEGFKKLLGYVAVPEGNSYDKEVYSEYEKLVWEDKQTQAAKNQAIEKSLEVLDKLVEEQPEAKELSVWFDWEYIRNGRLMLSSNTLNPQTDKQLHRFLVTPKDHVTNYSVLKVDDVVRFTALQEGNSGLDRDVDVTEDMHYTIAQAFGFGVDKQRTTEAYTFAAGLLQLGEAALAGAKKELLTKGEYSFTVNGSRFKAKVEHLGHLIQGIRLLEDIQKGGEVRSSLSAEFDDVTSGFAIKLLQYPVLEGVEGHLNRVGIRYDDRVVSMNDVIANGELLDSYQALGANFITVPAVEQEDLKELVGSGISRELVEAVREALPKAEVVDGRTVVTKELRDVFKPVFMVFNYAAGLKGIRGAMTNDLKNRLVKKLMQVTPETIKSPEGRLAQKLVSVARVNRVGELIQAFQSKPLNKIGSEPSVDKVLTEVIEATYGNAVEKLLRDSFPQYFQIQDAVNTSFKATFLVFEEMVKRKEAEWKAENKSKQVTDEVYNEIAMSLVDTVFPAIKGPLSEGLADGLVVAKQDKVSGESKVQTHIQPGLIGQKTMSVRTVVKKLGAAVKAGSAITIQQLDGAKLVKVINSNTVKGQKVPSYKGGEVDRTVGVTYIHDAVIPPIWAAKDVVSSANRMTYELGKEYGLLSEVKAMMDRTMLVVAEDPSLVEVLNKYKYKEESQLGDSLWDVQGLLNSWASNVEAARQATFSNIRVVGNSVGTSDMVYSVDGTKAVKQVVPSVTEDLGFGTIAEVTSVLESFKCK